jgi:hypothetical protein
MCSGEPRRPVGRLAWRKRGAIRRRRHTDLSRLCAERGFEMEDVTSAPGCGCQRRSSPWGKEGCPWHVRFEHEFVEENLWRRVVPPPVPNAIRLSQLRSLVATQRNASGGAEAHPKLQRRSRLEAGRCVGGDANTRKRPTETEEGRAEPLPGKAWRLRPAVPQTSALTGCTTL